MFSAALKFVAPIAIRQIPNKKIDPIYSKASREKDYLFKCVCVQSSQTHDMDLSGDLSHRPSGITSLSAELGLISQLLVENDDNDLALCLVSVSWRKPVFRAFRNCRTSWVQRTWF